MALFGMACQLRNIDFWQLETLTRQRMVHSMIHLLKLQQKSSLPTWANTTLVLPPFRIARPSSPAEAPSFSTGHEDTISRPIPLFTHGRPTGLFLVILLSEKKHVGNHSEKLKVALQGFAWNVPAAWNLMDQTYWSAQAFWTRLGCKVLWFHPLKGDRGSRFWPTLPFLKPSLPNDLSQHGQSKKPLSLRLQ